MKKREGLSGYYLFSISNLLAALGGGLVLGKGIGVIDGPYFQNGSMLAFFIGTIFGLIFLKIIPSKLSKKCSYLFSIFCAITSCLLLYVLTCFSENGKLLGFSGFVFFILLSIRFGFWFYARVIRAAIASGQQQSIAWVEFGYYFGMILGLIVWNVFKLNLNLNMALMIDIFFQLFAGLLDIKSNAIIKNTILKPITQNIETQFTVMRPVFYSGYIKLSVAVVFLTIGVQVVIFDLSHHVSESFAVYLLAIFYSGVALAAFFANKFKILLDWDEKRAHLLLKNGKKINLLISAIVPALFVFASVYILLSRSVFIETPFKYYWVGFFILMASFVYEIISLSILDRIGYEEKFLHNSGGVMNTYGFMGLGSAISLWLLSISPYHFKTSVMMPWMCFFILIGSMKAAPIQKRSATVL